MYINSKDSAGPFIQMTLEEAQSLLEKYGHSNIVSIDDISVMYCPNRIVLATTADGKVLNIKGFPKRNEDLVRHEVDIVHLLNEKNVGVQQLTQTADGEWSVSNENWTYLVYKGIDGEQMRYIDKRVCTEFAYNIARLHKALSLYEGHKVKPRVNEKFNTDIELLDSILDFPMSKKFQEVCAEFETTIDTSQLKTQVIHGGISVDHSFFKDNTFFAFIDWDYAHVGYRAYDIAVFMADMLITQPELMSIFLHEYNSLNLLTDMEMKSLYYFIQYRLITNISKYYTYDRTPEELEKGQDIARQMIREYEKLEAIGPEKFHEMLTTPSKKEGLIVQEKDIDRLGFVGICFHK